MDADFKRGSFFEPPRVSGGDPSVMKRPKGRKFVVCL